MTSSSYLIFDISSSYPVAIYYYFILLRKFSLAGCLVTCPSPDRYFGTALHRLNRAFASSLYIRVTYSLVFYPFIGILRSHTYIQIFAYGVLYFICWSKSLRIVLWSYRLKLTCGRNYKPLPLLSFDPQVCQFSFYLTSEIICRVMDFNPQWPSFLSNQNISTSY